MTVKPHTHFNGVLAAAMKRVDVLEAQLAAVLEPILLEAGTHAAREFEAMATDYLTAGAPRQVRARAGRPPRRVLSPSEALTAATPGLRSTSTMICVKPLPVEADALAERFGESSDSLHVTLVYIGDVEDVQPVIDAATVAAASHAPLHGTVAGSGVFSAAPGSVASPAILLPDVRGLVELRVAVTEALTTAGIDYSRTHGFEAHITVAYTEKPQEGAYRPGSFGQPLTFNEVLVVRGDVVEARIPLVGPRPLTAAAGWAAPAGDELLNVDRLVSTLRTKTDPVRLAAIDNVMKSSLDHVGIDYDITHPLAGKVLSQSGSQITHIAQSTQLNVMRIIGKAHEQGLTIPDTATAIRAGMADAAGSRALLIARTEMVGAVNGASLAAMQITSDSLGLVYDKVWMTAPGAPYPRHETYDGLDGQTVPLDGYFDVGGAQLENPGDPSGPPEEVCNCRCVAPWASVGGRFESASRRAFEGQLVRLTTAGGHHASVTPNHPILTRRGWVDAGRLKEGDDLICYATLDVELRRPHIDDVPAQAHQSFATLQLSASRTERVSGGSVNFHGEVPVGEVEVVWSHDALALEDESPLSQHLRKLSLALSHREMRSHRDTASLNRVDESQPVGLASVTNAFHPGVLEDEDHSRSSHGVTLADRKDAFSSLIPAENIDSDRLMPPLEADPLGVAHRAAHSTLLEVLPHGHSADAALVADLLVTHPGLIHLDPVVDVSFGDYSGHVFNFSTSDGTFSVGGIVTANCTMSYEEPGGGLQEAGGAEEGVLEPDMLPDQGYDERESITDGPATEYLDTLEKSWGESLTADEVGALKDWKREVGYKEINSYLRAGVVSANIEKRVALLDKAIKKSPPIDKSLNTVVFRGVDDLRGVLGDDVRVGKVMSDAGFTAVSTEYDVAWDYAQMSTKSGIIEIQLPPGSKGAWMRSAGLERTDEYYAMNENRELVLPRGQKYEVVGVRREGSMPVVTVRPTVEATATAEVRTTEATPTPETRAGVRSSDAYIASLQDELATTNNVISYMNRKVKAGTATKADTGRLEALRKRKEDIRQLILAPDPKGELSRIRNQMNYMKRKLREGSDTEETAARLKILQARADTLTALTKGDGLKIQKEAKKTAAKVVVPEKTAIQKLIEGAQTKVDAEKTRDLNYSSPFDLQTLLADEPVGKAVPVPAHSINTGGGYTYNSGPSIVWKDKSGVVFKREVGLEPWQQAEQDEIARKAEEMVASLPQTVARNLQMVTLAKRANPADPYWEKEFKKPGFWSAATGGHGEMYFWQTERNTFKQGVFDHEMGHISGSWGGPVDVSEWQSAKMRDKTFSAKLREKSFYGRTENHGVTIGETFVSSYGSNNTNEDWAESMRLWLLSRRTGSIGTVTDARGFLKPVSFAQVFPARAKILAREFGSGEYPPTG